MVILVSEPLQTINRSLGKHVVDGSENVMWKCDFAFLQSFLNYSQSLWLQNVF